MSKIVQKDSDNIMTLCIVHKHPKVLLGYKKRGFGMGRWNGFGGKVKENESIEEAAIRELKEESGLNATKIKKVGELTFIFKDNGKELIVHVFKVLDFSGEILESEEMKPAWFFIDEIPFREMWVDDVHWMPLFLAGHNFRGNFIFETDNVLADRNIEIVEKI